MKKALIIFSLSFAVMCLSAQNATSALLPMPNNCQTLQGKSFQITASTQIYADDSRLDFAVSELKRCINNRMMMTLASAGNHLRTATIRMFVDSSIKGSEHYVLKVNSSGVSISGSTPAAVLYGVMTLDQIMLGDVCSTIERKISPIAIDDSPRFPRRALMLDPARHFLPANDVKRYMDQMMKYKYNVLQLHLTDDQGWRIEIKGYPKLTAAGSYYTQEEMTDMIDYGAKRNIEIVPELDVPGHTVALLAAYPELGCISNDTVPKIIGKTTNMMVCAAQEDVYALYKDVIAQIGNVFTSPYIHLGGDEAVIDSNWGKCTCCQVLMKEKGYTKASQLMTPFFDRILKYVRKAEKKAVLWCELDNIYYPANDYLFPYPKDVILVSWRNGLTPTCIDITAKYGNQLLLAPGEYAYLDYPQYKGDLPEFNNWGMPTTTLQKSYEFDPGYGLAADKQRHLIGVMGTLWGEAIQDVNRAFYMTYPRGFALAEAGWTEMNHRGWDSFKQRMYPNLLDLIKCGVSVRAPFEIVNP